MQRYVSIARIQSRIIKKFHSIIKKNSGNTWADANTTIKTVWRFVTVTGEVVQKLATTRNPTGATYT